MSTTRPRATQTPMKNYSDLNNRERTVAIKRAGILDQYIGLKKNGCTRQEACRHLSVSSTTLSRWSRAFREHGLVGLADKMSNRRGGKSKMSEAQKNFLDKTTHTEFRPNLSAIYRDDYLPLCTTLNQEPVSYATFLRGFKRILKNEEIQDLKTKRELDLKLQQFKQKERTNG